MAQVSKAHARFQRLVAYLDVNQAQLSRELGCSRSFVSHLLVGERWPGRRCANAIKRLSTTEAPTPDRVAWKEPPIEPEEWDASQDAMAKAEARRAKRARKKAA